MVCCYFKQLVYFDLCGLSIMIYLLISVCFCNAVEYSVIFLHFLLCSYISREFLVIKEDE